MRKFISGLAIGIAGTIILVAALLLMLNDQIEREVSGIFGDWDEREKPNLKLTLYPLGEIDLSDTFGMGASELSEFLGQGDEEQKNSYLSVLESGIPIKIVLFHTGEGPERTQEITFRNGRVEGHILEISSEVEITMDTASTSNPALAEIDFLNSERLLRAVEKRLNGSGSSESVVETQVVTMEAEPGDADNPVNAPDDSNNHTDD